MNAHIAELAGLTLVGVYSAGILGTIVLVSLITKEPKVALFGATPFGILSALCFYRITRM